MLKFLALATMAAACFSFYIRVLAFEAVPSKLRSLKSSLDGCSDLSLFLGEWCNFWTLLLCFVRIFAAACFRGIALWIISCFFGLFFYLRLKKVKRLIHDSYDEYNYMKYSKEHSKLSNQRYFYPLKTHSLSLIFP